MPGLLLTREGDDLRLDDRDTSLRVRFASVKEGSDGLHAIVRVQYVNGVGPQDIIAPTRINLLTPRGKGDLERALKTRNPHMGHVDWGTLVEDACANAIRAIETGQPFIDLFEQPEPAWDQRELVKGFLPQGETTVVFADGGTGKSTLAGVLGLSIHTGVELIEGWRPTARVPAGFLDWESNWKEHRRRLGSVLQYAGIDYPKGFMYRDNYRALSDDIGLFRREVAERGIGFLVVDSAVPATGDDIKDTGAPRALFAGLRSLGDSVTRLVLAHMSKAEAEREQGRARVLGSVMFENLARSVWEMRASENAGEDEIVVGLYHRKMNGGKRQTPFALRVLFDPETEQPFTIQRVTMKDYPDLDDRRPRGDRLVELLSRGQHSTKEVADHLDLTPEAASKMLRRRSDIRQLSSGGGQGKAAIWGLATERETWWQ